MEADQRALWYYPEDKTEPVITAARQIVSKYGSDGWRKLPPKAVVFCMGKGLPILEANFSTEQLLETLPGFISHSKVLGLRGQDQVCYVHGGYGSPQITCTVETLCAMGVEEFLLIGLCGVFGEGIQVGDVLLPEKIWSEEGASRHYVQNPGFAKVNSSEDAERLTAFFSARGLAVRRANTVTTDAVFRQTYFKETLWREMGCVGVDMEASAFVNVCNYYGKKNTVLLLASDKHPLSPEEPAWECGGERFGELTERFVCAGITYVPATIS